ncbi:hypothetical protein KEM54_000985 [Ascosphaera aggregata]|nr:hypothetical protein KEM54_000985 [Ascosphaera aggregata]
MEQLACDAGIMSLRVHFHGQAHLLTLPSSKATLQDLSDLAFSVFKCSAAVEISSVDDAAASAAQKRGDTRSYLVKPERPGPRAVPVVSQWTFHTLRPLSYLPHPERSLKYLARLRGDPGDGYRSYRVVRDTLCHELAHCVYSEHDRNFWDLTKQIEREVRQNDYWSHGQALTEMEFYNPEKDLEDERTESDHGGWTGGQYVLGHYAAGIALSRREFLAQAAERRLRRVKSAESEEPKEDTTGDGISS